MTSSRYSVPVLNNTHTMRQTWNTVTSGTPSCKVLAVMVISAMPPGDIPRNTVGQGRPAAWLTPREATAVSNNPASVTNATTVRKRGARLKKPGVNLLPSD